MKGIPPEVDQLLWDVAEDPSERASEEFVQRYPHFAGELARRRAMVMGLKGEKRSNRSTPRPTPSFRQVARPPVSPQIRWAVGGLVVAAVGVLSFTVSTALLPRTVVAPPPVSPVVETPIKVPSPPVYTRALPSNSPERGNQNTSPQGLRPPASTQIPGLSPAIIATETNPTTQTFHVKGARLSDALAMLGEQAKVKIVVAPGLKDRTIDADYDSRQFNEILLDLGKKYTFTPFDQGDGSVIVVPAVDTLAANTPTGIDSKPADR